MYKFGKIEISYAYNFKVSVSGDRFRTILVLRIPGLSFAPACPNPPMRASGPRETPWRRLKRRRRRHPRLAPETERAVPRKIRKMKRMRQREG